MRSRFTAALSTLILALIPVLALAANTGVDSSFGTDSGHYRYNRASYNEYVYDAVIDSQGRILLAFLLEDASNPGTYWPAIMRLLADGTGDTSFGFLGIWFESAIEAEPDCTVSIAVDSSDRPILGWTYEFEQGSYTNRDWYIRRLTTSGALDAAKVVAFDIGINGSGDRLDEMTDLMVLSDGRIVAIGGAQYDNADWDFAIGVIKDNGTGGLTADTSFDTDGRRTVAFDLTGSSKYDNASAVTVDSTGNLVLVGWSNSDHGNVVSVCRLDEGSGSMDTSFSTTGKANYEYVPFFDPALPSRGTEVASLASGGFIVGAVLTDQTNNKIGALRIESDGSADLAFGSAGWFFLAPTYPGQPFDAASSTLTGVAVDNNRLVYSASIVDPLDSNQSQGIVIVTDLTGLLDTSFSPGGYDFYTFEPSGEQTGTAFSSVLIPGNYIIGVSSGKAVLVGSMRGVTSGGSRNDSDLLATQIFTKGLIFSDGFESGGTTAWSSTSN